MTYQEITNQIRSLDVKPEDKQVKTAILEALKDLTNPNRPKENPSYKNAILTALRQAKKS